MGVNIGASFSAVISSAGEEDSARWLAFTVCVRGRMRTRCPFPVTFTTDPALRLRDRPSCRSDEVRPLRSPRKSKRVQNRRVLVRPSAEFRFGSLSISSPPHRKALLAPTPGDCGNPFTSCAGFSLMTWLSPKPAQKALHHGELAVDGGFFHRTPRQTAFLEVLAKNNDVLGRGGFQDSLRRSGPLENERTASSRFRTRGGCARSIDSRKRLNFLRPGR